MLTERHRERDVVGECECDGLLIDDQVHLDAAAAEGSYRLT
jgi:hypothetical protein